jgi:hypothetical protein
VAKQTGLGDQLFISAVDIGADINSIGAISTPVETLPATAITQSAEARFYGKRDGHAEFTSYFNAADGETHDTLKALPRTDVHVMYCRGEAVGNEGIGLVGKQIDYAPTRGDDGSLLFNVSVEANGFGLDWGKQLTAGKDTHASATNGATLDTTAAIGATAFGFQAYLQAFSIGSGTAEVTIQDSADGAAWTDLTDGAFTDVTAPVAERIQSSSATATVRRYLRVITTGTFTNLVFAVIINKNRGTRAI